MFKNKRMETRLQAGFSGMILLSILLGLVAFLNLSAMNSHWHEFESVTLATKDAVLAGNESLGNAIHYSAEAAPDETHFSRY
ncbi:hypothetical protein [Noviherbaspirillum saxi]|uniref:Uncharacterized protein n=1 Tax=Noviherbaspirillum saxi TaxID=2320863 RepID=A0A3A3FWC0_9BURK|nr:hypothetical protein [Noviherbaspirillum saxi]RJF98908.1 hypothetical protein D3871_10590 [Noviherbaspirillum saxi]